MIGELLDLEKAAQDLEGVAAILTALSLGCDRVAGIRGEAQAFALLADTVQGAAAAIMEALEAASSHR